MKDQRKTCPLSSQGKAAAPHSICVRKPCLSISPAAQNPFHLARMCPGPVTWARPTAPALGHGWREPCFLGSRSPPLLSCLNPQSRSLWRGCGDSLTRHQWCCDSAHPQPLWGPCHIFSC